MNKVIAAGIDLGGTKIEAGLFDKNWATVRRVRIDTPKDSYESLLDALTMMVHDISTHEEKSERLPIGVGIPGLINADTGNVMTSNLPARGKPLHRDLMKKLGRDIACINDCRAFTLSEANLGAGRHYRNVVGLIMGTGLAGSQAIDGVLTSGLNGIAGEIGHIPLPASLVNRFDLPLRTCGCGRVGCFETLGAGPGLTQIAAHITGKPVATTDIIRHVQTGDEAMIQVYNIWGEIIAHLIDIAMLTMDPDVIVLGGGLSKITGVETHLRTALENSLLADTRCPDIRIAEDGDSSGTRGAAFMAHSNQVPTK